MHADITEGTGAKERIDNGVRHDITIGVSEAAFVVRNANSAYNQWNSSLQSVNIEAVADPYC